MNWGWAGRPPALPGDQPACGAPRWVTFGGACSPQVVDGSQDEPAGFLFIRGDAQHLHGRLELTELLSCLLLLLRLQGWMGTRAADLRRAVLLATPMLPGPQGSPGWGTATHPELGSCYSPGALQATRSFSYSEALFASPSLPAPPYRPLTLASGTIPNTLFSAKWFKWSSVLGVHTRCQRKAGSPHQVHLPTRLEAETLPPDTVMYLHHALPSGTFPNWPGCKASTLGCLLSFIIYPFLGEHRQQAQMSKGKSLAEEPTSRQGGQRGGQWRKGSAFGPHVGSNTSSAPHWPWDCGKVPDHLPRGVLSAPDLASWGAEILARPWGC